MVFFFLKQGQNNAGLSHHGRLQSRIIYQAEEIQSQGPPSCSTLIRSQQRSALLLSRSGGSREHRPGSGSATRIQGAGGAWGSPWDSSDPPQSAPHSDFLDAPFALEAPEVSLKPFCASFYRKCEPWAGLVAQTQPGPFWRAQTRPHTPPSGAGARIHPISRCQSGKSGREMQNEHTLGVSRAAASGTAVRIHSGVLEGSPPMSRWF